MLFATKKSVAFAWCLLLVARCWTPWHSKLINLMCDIFCCHITSLKHHDLLWFGSVLGSRRHDLLFFCLQLQPPISARSVGWGFGPHAIHKEYSQSRIKYLLCGCNAFDCIMFWRKIEKISYFPWNLFLRTICRSWFHLTSLCGAVHAAMWFDDHRPHPTAAG